MPRDTRDTRTGHHGTAAPARPRQSSQGDVDVAPDMDLAGVVARLTKDLERFDAAMTIERKRMEHPMPFEQPGRHSERISSSVTALVAELMQILALLRRLRETDELYGQAPAPTGAGPQPSRQRRQETGPT
jgi:hypothetical protein